MQSHVRATRTGRTRRNAVTALVLALVSVACGSSAQGGSATSALTVTTIPTGVYAVQRGDTLTKVARALCDGPEDVLSIFEANRGRPQADGGALVDPNLIEIGWQLVIDCSAEPGVFSPAAATEIASNGEASGQPSVPSPAPTSA